MGEVYRARDTRLDRTVAIKVLPSDLAADPHLKARFERETHAISALAHPNICTLYDVGEEDGQTFLVMEHLVGQTLAERLTKGPLPLAQALEVATQIADALAAAHKQGIVHRDLKPGNVMLTKTGAQLLDFGLARLTAHGEQPAVGSLTSAPTQQAPLTGEGTILGTLPYMAPEQVEGKPADARTDLWALGTILYEMVTGVRAFEASTPTSLVGAILEREPTPLKERQPLTPPSLERLVRRCLAKDPDERWDTAHDLADELRWVAETAAAPGPEASRARSTARRMTPWVLGVLAVMATALAAWTLIRPETRPIARLSVVLPPGERLGLSPAQAAIAISPDGSRLAYVAEREGAPRQLYLRALDELEPTPLPGTEGAVNPFFSPDGQWVGFIARGKLKKISVTGGAPITLCDAHRFQMGATWAPDDTIIFRRRQTRGLCRVSASGGPPEVLTSPDVTKGEQDHKWPEILPGGRAVLYSFSTADVVTTDDAHIAVLSLDTGEEKLLLEGGHGPRYAPTGHLVYARGGTLRAVKFDLERLEATEPSVQVLAGVRTHQEGGAPSFAFSRNGTLVYVPGGPQPDRTLVWVNRQGVASAITPDERGYSRPRLSPDGQRIAVSIGWRNGHLWVYDLSRGTFSPLTHRWDNNDPVWTPDGTRVLFRSDRGGQTLWNVFWTSADGSGEVEQLLEADRLQAPHSISPDGEVLAFTRRHDSRGWDILLYPMNGEGEPREFVATEFDENFPRFSPDGRWVAYDSYETGQREVYVKPFPDPGASVRISTEGGARPVWAPSGRELFYRDGDKMMAVTVETEPEFSAARPRLLYEGRYQWNYDISPDGERFLMIREPETEPVTQLHVVFNWFEELKRLVPTD
jgi:serine/threonine-protein kinase